MHAHPGIQGNHETEVRPARADAGRLLGVGATLILVGVVAVLARSLALDLGAVIGEATWPLLVIVPGLVLIGLAYTRKPPDGLGLAIAGSVITAVGTILLVQANTGAWESWAYVWILIPGAAGLGMAGYGLLTRTAGLIDRGVWMVVISGIVFLVARWYFEAVFATGDQPVDLATWWPLGLVAAGVLVAARALLEWRRGSTPTTVPDVEGGTTP